MKVHYRNGKGEEVFLDGIIHLQNVEKEQFYMGGANAFHVCLDLLDKLEME